MPNEPPTDRQLEYAKDLGITVPPDMTKDDISEAISARVDNDKLPTERHLGFARDFGLNVSKYVGKKELFDRIMSFVSKPGRETDLVSWFVFRVYRNLMHGADGGPIDRPTHPIIQEIATKMGQYDSAVKSIRRYKGRDLIWFGEWTAPNGVTSWGGSDKTIAYKMASASLKETLKFPRRESFVKGQDNRSVEESDRIRICRDCKKPISRSAGRCPHCGARHDYNSYAWALIIAIGLATLMSMIFQCGN